MKNRIIKIIGILSLIMMSMFLISISCYGRNEKNYYKDTEVIDSNTIQHIPQFITADDADAAGQTITVDKAKQEAFMSWCDALLKNGLPPYLSKFKMQTYETAANNTKLSNNTIDLDIWYLQGLFKEKEVDKTILDGNKNYPTELSMYDIGDYYYFVWANTATFRKNSSAATFGSTDYIIHSKSTSTNDNNIHEGNTLKNYFCDEETMGDTSKMGVYFDTGFTSISDQYNTISYGDIMGTIGNNTEQQIVGYKVMGIITMKNTEGNAEVFTLEEGKAVNYWVYGIAIRKECNEIKKVIDNVNENGGQIYISHKIFINARNLTNGKVIKMGELPNKFSDYETKSFKYGGVECNYILANQDTAVIANFYNRAVTVKCNIKKQSTIYYTQVNATWENNDYNNAQKVAENEVKSFNFNETSKTIDINKTRATCGDWKDYQIKLYKAYKIKNGVKEGTPLSINSNGTITIEPGCDYVVEYQAYRVNVYLAKVAGDHTNAKEEGCLYSDEVGVSINNTYLLLDRFLMEDNSREVTLKDSYDKEYINYKFVCSYKKVGAEIVEGSHIADKTQEININEFKEADCAYLDIYVVGEYKEEYEVIMNAKLVNSNNKEVAIIDYSGLTEDRKSVVKNLKTETEVYYEYYKDISGNKTIEYNGQIYDFVPDSVEIKGTKNFTNNSVTVQHSDIVITGTYKVRMHNVYIYLLADAKPHDSIKSAECLKKDSIASYTTVEYSGEGYEKGKKFVGQVEDGLNTGKTTLMTAFSYNSQKYKLSNSFIQYENNIISNHVDNTYTSRNVGQVASDIYIMAEYEITKYKVEEYIEIRLNENSTPIYVKLDKTTGETLQNKVKYNYSIENILKEKANSYPKDENFAELNFKWGEMTCFYRQTRIEQYKGTVTSNNSSTNGEVTINEKDIAIYYVFMPDVVTVTVYFKAEKGEHTGYSSNCLNINSTDILSPVKYSFYKGQIINLNNQEITADGLTTVNGISVNNQLGVYKLSAVYQQRVPSNHIKASNTNSTAINLGCLYFNEVVIAEYYKNGNGGEDNEEFKDFDDLDPNARGVIAPIANDKYNAYYGIPTDKTIYADMIANDYLINSNLTNYSGWRKYAVKTDVEYTIKYKCNICANCQGHSYTVTKAYINDDITRTYSYWGINNYEVFRKNSAYLKVIENANKNNILLEDAITYNDEVNVLYQQSNKRIIDQETTCVKEFSAETVTLDIGQISDMAKLMSTINEKVKLYETSKNNYNTISDNKIEQIKVQNDHLVINNQVILQGDNNISNGISTVNTKADGLKISKVTKETRFQSKQQLIDVKESNGLYYCEQSKIRYVSQAQYNKDASGDIVCDIHGYTADKAIITNAIVNIDKTLATEANKTILNDIIVHEPVYLKGVVKKGNNDIENVNNNQKVNKDDTEIVLDKDFVLEFTVTGTVRNLIGYKNINTWGNIATVDGIKQIEVKFPFDVYFKNGENDYTQLKSDTWYNISEYYNETTGKGEITLKIPLWTQEGENNIRLRVKAVNDLNLDTEGDGLFEKNADNRNGIITHTFLTYTKGEVAQTDKWDAKGEFYINEPQDYRAYYDVPLEVVGRIYDFTFEYTNDSGYTKWMRSSFAGLKGNQLPFGQAKQDTYNPNNIYAIKLGNYIKFTVKTKGTRSEQIKIEPSLYWVSKSGGTAQAVDAWYEIDGNKYEKLSPSSTITIETTADDLIDRVKQNVGFDDKLALTKRVYDNKDKLKDAYFPTSLIPSYNRVCSTGTIGKILLNENVRLRLETLDQYVASQIYGNLTKEQIIDAAGSYENFVKSTSQWFGQWHLPSKTVFVGKGEENIIAKRKANGYIIVVFDIKTLDEKGNEYLSYEMPTNNNQWKKEEYEYGKTIVLPNGKTAELPEKAVDASATICIYESKLNKDGNVVGQ